MHKTRRQMMTGAMKWFDLALMVVSFGVAALPVPAKAGLVSFAQLLEIKVKLENILVFVCLLALWHFLFSILGLYDSKRLSGRRAEALDVLQATSL
jgi:hypothetical protein